MKRRDHATTRLGAFALPMLAALTAGAAAAHRMRAPSRSRRCAGGGLEQPRAAPSDPLHKPRGNLGRGSAGGRRGFEPEPERRRLSLPEALQARGQRPAGDFGACGPPRPGVDGAIATGHSAPRSGGRHRLPPGTGQAPAGSGNRRSSVSPISGPSPYRPTCDKWGENVGRNEARIPYPNFGCATQHNTAIMVDNARDLQRPQDEDPRASERRSVTWSAYVGGAVSLPATAAAATHRRKRLR